MVSPSESQSLQSTCGIDCLFPRVECKIVTCGAFQVLGALSVNHVAFTI